MIFDVLYEQNRCAEIADAAIMNKYIYIIINVAFVTKHKQKFVSRWTKTEKKLVEKRLGQPGFQAFFQAKVSFPQTPHCSADLGIRLTSTPRMGSLYRLWYEKVPELIFQFRN